MTNLQSARPSEARVNRAGARPLEVAAWCAGIVLISAFVGARLDASLGRRAALREFESARVAAPRPALRPLAAFASPDRKLWSPERVQGFQASLSQEFQAPLAVLRVPKIDLEVPVLEGTDEPALNRGVGHISGTPRPGEPGNVGIAGHRDGFFRGLKDVAAGDLIEVETHSERLSYRIRSLTIVTPESIEVLDPTVEPTLTLVTCYPFYYAGSAPQRFIVRATFEGSAASQAAERRSRAP